MRLWKRAHSDDLLDRQFLLATTDNPLELGVQVLDQEMEFGVRGTQAADGTAVLPVFTSEKRLVEWLPEGSHWFGLSGRDMLLLFLSSDEWEAIVIDPTGSKTEIFRAEAQRLLDAE